MLVSRKLKRKQEKEGERGSIGRKADTLSMLPTATAIDNSLENSVKPL